MDTTAEHVVARATKLARAARDLQTSAERAEAKQMAGMMADPAGKAFTLAMADRVFRSSSPAKQADRVRGFLKQFGVPRYLPTTQRLMLKTGGVAAGILPGPVMKAMENQLRAASSRVILDAAPAPLNKYLDQRHAAGTRVNLNHLGEAVLGEEEARRRLNAVIEHLRNPKVDYVSIKISAIFSQISVIDFVTTLGVIKDRLRALYRAAKEVSKFVNLDMEEYRDLGLTLAAFQDVLAEPEFVHLTAGIVLQAYLPDSWTAQQRLTAWAKQRVASGGAPIKMRLVKGANLAMEAVEAELHGWNPAPYPTKTDTDANYRRMLDYGCRPENAAAVKLGVASHNLFDVALALTLREQHRTADRVELEMLEGMANQQARAAQAESGGMLLYAPVVGRHDFLGALAYLVRRLDENTSPENYLHDLFDLHPGTAAWERQTRRFIDGWAQRTTVSAQSRRLHDTSRPADGAFHNVADTDWTRRDHREALQFALSSWHAPELPTLPPLDELLDTAVAAQRRWTAIGSAARADVLNRAADRLAESRFTAIAHMVNEAKKAALEADVEVSEAIDFARYHATLADESLDPLGVVLVTPPWNFPYAIPCGNVTAALAAGNSVVLKPAPETAGIAWLLANQLWDAGVPRDVLQFYACVDGEDGRALVTDPRVATVVLTGAYETARMFLSWRPSLRLIAETSGKNAIVVTAQADRDLAVKDLVKSAFGHAGQKCSAASLGILEAEVYDDPAFRRALRDAATSLKVGPSTDLGSIVTPLIREPSISLMKALTTLEPDEEWLLRPSASDTDPCLWSPGIKLGVKPGSWFHQTECFGPVLGLMRARDLNEAIALQNDTPFGLAGGIHSLDDAEVATWTARVRVGNAYVNRPITGAIVRRQPFGGWKRSSIGIGVKAGGPNYVAAFGRPRDDAAVTPDYEQAFATHFAGDHDPSGLRCESNVLRYRPAGGVILRIDGADTRQIERARHAAQVCNVALEISRIGQESDDAFAKRLVRMSGRFEFLRSTKPLSDAVLRAAYDAGLNWINASLVASGRHELPRWLREQAVARTRHRYGLIEQ